MVVVEEEEEVVVVLEKNVNGPTDRPTRTFMHINNLPHY